MKGRIRPQSDMSVEEIHVVSLFSGALGLDIGLEKGGAKLCVTVESNVKAAETFSLNASKFACKNILSLNKKLNKRNLKSTFEKIKKHTSAYEGDLILAGAPPCQPFSTAGRRNSLRDERSSGFSLMADAIEILKPKYFVIENVRGLLSASISHRPLKERGGQFPELRLEELHGSAFDKLMGRLKTICEDLGYCIVWGVLNSADFGAGQKRLRVFIIGSLEGAAIWPSKSHDQHGASNLPKWRTLKDALAGLKQELPEFTQFSSDTINYISLVSAGGNWRSLPVAMQKKALGAAFNSWGGRSGFLRRLSFDSPAPTLTGHPRSRATMMCHPVDNRPLSVQECARIQGFPDDWLFAGTTYQKYLQIGNATPVMLGKAIAEAIRENRLNKAAKYNGKMFCADKDLLEKMKHRPRTILDPAYKRSIDMRDSDNFWRDQSKIKRQFLLDQEVMPGLEDCKAASSTGGQ